MNPVEKKLLEFARTRFGELCKEMNVPEKDVIISVRPKTRDRAKVLSSMRRTIARIMNGEGFNQVVLAKVFCARKETVNRWINNS